MIKPSCWPQKCRTKTHGCKDESNIFCFRHRPYQSHLSDYPPIRQRTTAPISQRPCRDTSITQSINQNSLWTNPSVWDLQFQRAVAQYVRLYHNNVTTKYQRKSIQSRTHKQHSQLLVNNTCGFDFDHSIIPATRHDMKLIINTMYRRSQLLPLHHAEWIN